MAFRYYFLSIFHVTRIVLSTRHTWSHLIIIEIPQVVLQFHFADKEKCSEAKNQVQGQSVIKGQSVTPNSDLSDIKTHALLFLSVKLHELRKTVFLHRLLWFLHYE